jgi:hypothetical protein
MKLPKIPLASLGHYRIVNAAEPASRVAAKLEHDPAPYLVVRRDFENQASWFVFDTDDWLLDMLQGEDPVERCLRLAARDRTPVLKFEKLLRKTRTISSGPIRDRIVVDASGVVKSVVGQRPLFEEDVVVYPVLRSSAQAVAPDEVMEFAVQLEGKAPKDASTELDLHFQQGEEKIPVHVSVSSRDFKMPDETSWATIIQVNRDLTTVPATWNFKAQALGERDSYTVRVTFHVRGCVAGNVTATLSRTGATSALSAISPAGPLTFPQAAADTLLTLLIAEDGETQRLVTALRGGNVVAQAKWIVGADPGHFEQLQRAKTLEQVGETGNRVFTSLPQAIRDLLENDPHGDSPLLITGQAPYAPFEITEIPSGDQALLGVRRPVLRWIDDVGQQPQTSAPLDKLLCIRPDYPTAALPKAIDEQKYLEDHLPSASRLAAQTEVDLRPLLNDGSIRAIHFAGHAQANPAGFKLKGEVLLRAAFFGARTPLMREGQPFMFMNGCHAGAGKLAAPADQANMVRQFLVNKARAVVAPAIAVDSQAALAVAQTFYERIQAGDTIGVAMHAVRAAALDADPAIAGSYFSYLAFAPPSLHLTWPA